MSKWSEILKCYLQDIFLYRVALVAVCGITVGLSWDMAWHGDNPLREHYFIFPHIVLYVNILLLLLSLAILKLRLYKISLWVFVLFPILSVFDEFWHSTYGIELATSPMMFWSPAHWPFGLIVIYILYVLYRTNIERNEHIILFVRALLFFVQPFKFLIYVLTPLALYSKYVHLHSDISIVFGVFLLLVVFTLYKIFHQADIILLGITLVMLTGGGHRSFYFQNDSVYSNPQALFFVYLIAALFVVSGYVQKKAYVLTGIWAASCIFFVKYAQLGVFDLSSFALSIGIVVLFAVVYFDIENFLIPHVRQIFNRKV